MATYLRSVWGAKPPKWPLTPLHQVPNGVVHHIGGGNAYPSNVVATLQQIQSSEQHGEYVDIAYNWGVDKDGNLWELRGDVQDGATKGFAGSSFSVLAICNAAAPDFVASAALIAGIAACFRNAQTRGVLGQGCRIDGHTVFDRTQTSHPTSCPGALEQHITQICALISPVALPPKVEPMFPGPGLVMKPWKAAWKDKSGNVVAAVSDDFDVYAFGVPYRRWDTKMADTAGRHAAKIGPAVGIPGRYSITATSGEVYTP